MYSKKLIEKYYKYVPKKDQNAIYWWFKYLYYCNNHNINPLEQTYEKYENIMEKVYEQEIEKIIKTTTCGA